MLREEPMQCGHKTTPILLSRLEYSNGLLDMRDTLIVEIAIVGIGIFQSGDHVWRHLPTPISGAAMSKVAQHTPYQQQG